MAFVLGVAPGSKLGSTRRVPSSVSLHQQHAVRFAGARRVARRSVMRPTATVQMNLFDRFFRVLRASLHAVAGRFEDPEKIIEQSITDMQQDLSKVRYAYAQVSATMKRTERELEHTQSLSEGWKRRAEIALRNGEEPLAREALLRKHEADQRCKATAAQLETLRRNVENLEGSLQEIDSKTAEARRYKDELIARASAAKTTNRINDMLNAVGSSSGLAAFEQMRAKVEALEAESEATKVLSLKATPSVEARFLALEGGNAVDQELAHMKEAIRSSPRFLAASSDPIDLKHVRIEVEAN